MPDPRPTIGAAVHFCSLEGQHCAAFVTEVSRDGVGAVIQACGLFVLHPDGVQLLRDVPYDAAGTTGGGWHWPEREPLVREVPFTPLFCETCGDQVGEGTTRKWVSAGNGRVRCEACVQTRGWE